MGADRRPVTDAERARIVAMRAERLTIDVIAARTGYARSTVKRVLGDVRPEAQS